MATLSTLELMLLDLQNQENLDTYNDHGRLPMLPQRPVSRARMPSRRTRRAVLSFHNQDFGGKKKEEFVDIKSERDGFAIVNGGFVLHKNEMKNDGEEETEKGIIGIQKCFRGYKARLHYHKLKEGIITLQSFIRGENARTEFEKSIKRSTRTHNNQEFVWKPLRDRETTILYLQSVVREWLSRKHRAYIEHATVENTKEADDDPHNEDIESEEQVTVSESYIRELEQQVLRTEAALRHKICENSNLELQIQQIDTKWKLHNAMMNSKEKTWQDELNSIQMSLASVRERMTEEITYLPRNPTTRHEEDGKTILTIKQILELQETDPNFGIDNPNSRRFQEQELKKLKVRFKTWKKEFKARLHNMRRILNRFDDHSRTQKVHKSCFIS